MYSTGPKGAIASTLKGKESNNHPQGRSGSKVNMKGGPAKGNSGISNPTSGGGINRSTKSKS